MIENSSAGLVKLDAEVSVSVTREEHHQPALARYTVTEGQERHVAVELAWCTIDSGKYRGERGIEVRLDGQRVGELTYLMSRRYAPLVAQVTALGGRPGCTAAVQLGARGLEVVLRLPRHGDGVLPLPVPAPATATYAPVGAPMAPVIPMPPQRTGPFAKHRPVWIVAAVVGLLVIIGLANSGNKSPKTSTAAQVAASSSTTAVTTTKTTTRLTTTTQAPTTTTTTTTTTTQPTTTVEKPAPAPVPPVVPPAPAPEPAPVPEPAPASDCDPNYSGCVPIASDVDCEGGSGNGPAYVRGPVQVIGSDIYKLDNDHDGIGCE
ncbi:MAG: hypothetical protein ABIQ18_25965 [Umezawaea sp.]